MNSVFTNLYNYVEGLTETEGFLPNLEMFLFYLQRIVVSRSLRNLFQTGLKILLWLV